MIQLCFIWFETMSKIMRPVCFKPGVILHDLINQFHVVPGDHAKEESVVHEVKVERANGDFQDEEGELLDKARDIPDIRKKSDKEVN